MSKQQNTPQYIKQLPWYAKNQEGQGPSINTPSFTPKSQLQDWYDRGKKGYQATTFRKGACENCGGMGHTKKQCTQRPRKIGAKFTNQKIAPDDVVKNIQLNWEGKRDRWNGYQPQMYKEVIEEYQEFEEVRKKRKVQDGQEDLDSQYKQTTDPLALASLPSKHAKNQKFQGLGGVRNRQDRAKYLNNLDLNSTPFDPKSRSMKDEDNPYSAVTLNNLSLVGQKYDLTQQDAFANQQVEKHNSQLSSIALPTLTQKIYKTMKQKNQSINSGKMGQLISKYGVDLTQKNKGIEIVYQEDTILDYKNQIKKFGMIKSSYQEDIYINDHQSVWGSWYSPLLGWGYSCCHSTQKMSYCLGNKGKQRALGRQLKIKAQRLRQLNQIVEMDEKDQQNIENKS